MWPPSIFFEDVWSYAVHGSGFRLQGLQGFLGVFRAF